MNQSLRRCCAILLIFLAVGLAPAAAQQGAARAALDAWLEHINGATDEEMQAYSAEAFSAGFLEQVPLTQINAIHAQLRALAPYALDSLESESATQLVALLRSANDTWFRLQLTVSGEPVKIDGILVQPSAPPTADQAIEWDTLDELAAGLSSQFDLPGVALAWARLDQEPHVGVAGVRALGGDPAQPTDRFHIGSLTKSVTSTALARLVERGDLRWDATLAELLLGYEMNEVYAAMTLERLVRHRARIQQHSTFDDAEMARLNGLPGSTTEQRATYVAEVLLLEPLEPRYAYSNAGYAIAGHIGELAAGESWEELVENEVFTPLGLDSCGIGWPATAVTPEQPRGHYGGRSARRVQGLDDYRLGAFMRPAGDVNCSITDLLRYGQAHLAGLRGEDGFLTAASVRELHRVDDVPYAAGWGVDPESGQHRHNGSAGTFYSYLTIDPEAGLVVAFLANAGPPDAQLAGARAAEEILGRHAAQ